MEAARLDVAYASLYSGVICMAAYVALVIRTLFVKPADVVHGVKKHKGAANERSLVPSVEDASKFVEATAKLTDSLAKAGPMLTSLIGAVLFYAIAATASGALQGTPPAPPSDKGAPSNASEAAPGGGNQAAGG